MTKYKMHYVPKELVNLYSKKTTFAYDQTNAIRMIRMAYMQKDTKGKILGFVPNCYVINDAIFIRMEKIKIDRIVKHLRFDGGFIPLSRIKTVGII